MNNNKMIDWHIGDLEQRFGFKGGKYTDVNSWFVLLLTFVLTAVFFIGLCYLPSSLRSL